MGNRIDVKKTYKTYINGKFTRTESGRYYPVKTKDDKLRANMCRCSRKDVREAVVAARNALEGWKSRTAYNRGQIIYRIAEVLETRKDSFVDELKQAGYTSRKAVNEVEITIDRLIYYAGWTDKYQQVFSTVNPVASAHFNFSVPEPMGVTGIIAPETHPLSGIVSLIAPAITGANTVVVLASEADPLCSYNLAEVLHASDVPAGVVNILTGLKHELIPTLSLHMDVNALFANKESESFKKEIEENASKNVKRVFWTHIVDWNDKNAQNPYLITDLQEIKTTWHPIGV